MALADLEGLRTAETCLSQFQRPEVPGEGAPEGVGRRSVCSMPLCRLLLLLAACVVFQACEMCYSHLYCHCHTCSHGPLCSSYKDIALDQRSLLLQDDLILITSAPTLFPEEKKKRACSKVLEMTYMLMEILHSPGHSFYEKCQDAQFTSQAVEMGGQPATVRDDAEGRRHRPDRVWLVWASAQVGARGQGEPDRLPPSSACRCSRTDGLLH